MIYIRYHSTYHRLGLAHSLAPSSSINKVSSVSTLICQLTVCKPPFMPLHSVDVLSSKRYARAMLTTGNGRVYVHTECEEELLYPFGKRKAS